MTRRSGVRRRDALRLGLGAASLAAAGTVRRAMAAADPSGYPVRPVRLVVPFAAGGGTDLVMRSLADAIGSSWGQQIFVDNKPGAGTTLGAVNVLGSPPDGYTLLANTASFLISPELMSRRPYRLEDFAPVALVASSPHVLVVSNGVPAGTLAEFLFWAKAKPEPMTFASFGTGSSSHLGFEILAHQAGIRAVHVPYRGASPAIVDLLGGRVDAMLADLSTVAEHVKTGGVRALAVAGEHRAASLPDVPTAAEAGLPGFRSQSWFGLVARAGTPPGIVERWGEAVKAALATAAVRSKLDAIGIEPYGQPAAAFGPFMREEAETYAAAVKQAGIAAE